MNSRFRAKVTPSFAQKCTKEMQYNKLHTALNLDPSALHYLYVTYVRLSTQHNTLYPSTLGLTILTWSAPAAERSLKLYTCMPCTKCIGRGRVDSQALQQPQPRATRPALARRPRRESHFSATVGLQLGLRHMHRMALICAGDSPQPPNHCFPALGCPAPPPHRRSLGTATQERERQPQQHWR